ncbi:leucyl aminopeptidase [Aliikangiella coralliicola]|uniref:Probable cytosol aminopeptidase n=1 Tax=Aliikangiella coralliicola TaxID=2592383 RepID=A0A545UAH5_9GAMM|nr:leucyl aminopeptidase [Aliikangiella coralliicola]TQV86462.1 leucyl aminopeptidase [Aliikangiella coralliicola]
MEFNVKSGNPEKQRSACVVIGVFESRKLSAMGEQLDSVSEGYLSNLLRRGDMEGKLGQILLLHNVPNTLSDRVLLIGCGKERDFGDKQYRKVISKAITTLNDTGSMEAVCFLSELNVKGRDTRWKVKQAIEAAQDTLYTFEEFKSKTDSARRPLRRLTFNVTTRKELTVGEKAIEEGLAVAKGSHKARDLGNMPPNVANPTYLAEQAKILAVDNDKVDCQILDEAELDDMGMGAFVAVAKGSDTPAKLIVLNYKGADPEQKPIVLVGKGITFDSGGISIKPGERMDEMKYDMGGAAGVFGTFVAVTELNLPVNLIVLIAAAENMPGGKAYRPGDIVTSLSGQTIEILNTDAEGRLVLCDTLTYAERFDPDVVIDVATLTGACVIALGSHASGLMSNHNPLAHDLLNAGEHCGDRVWRLPLWDEYQEQLECNFADMANVGGRAAGTITAGCFLARYTKKYNWAHLDIAGTAWKSGKAKGATGRPVPLLTQYIMDRCED